MNSVFFLIPLLLAVSIPSVYGQIITTQGQNYDLIEDFTIGEATWTSHPERIFASGEWQNYVLEDTDDKVIFNSNSVGSLIYHKNYCSYTIHENGFNGDVIIPTVSSVAIYLKDGTWQHLPVNDESCTVSTVSYDNGVILTATKTITQDVTEDVFIPYTGTSENFYANATNSSFTLIQSNGTNTGYFNGETITGTVVEEFTQEIRMDINSGFKETFKVTHEGSEKLGITQTIHTGAEIVIGDTTINIEQYNGQSFDREFIVENKAEILKLTDSINYDFDEGINSLSNVNIIFEDNKYKVNLDYSSGDFVGYLEIDPTFSYTTGTWKNTQDNSCNGTADGSPNASMYIDTNTSWCFYSGAYWDISSIDDTAIITGATLRYDVISIGAGGGDNGNIRSIEGNLSTMTQQQIQDDILDGTLFLTSSSNFVTVANDYTLVNNSDMIADIQAELSVDNEWGVGFYSDDQIQGENDLTDLGTTDTELQVTYSIPTAPDAPTNLTTVTGIPIELDWTAPVDDGDSAILNYKVYRTLNEFALSELPDNSGSDSQIDFTDNELLIHGDLVNYKVHSFTTTGASTFQITAGSGDIEYLVVGGAGGGGGGGVTPAGSGGGAGGFLTGTISSMGTGSYTTTVGDGGNGGVTNSAGSVPYSGTSGGNSVFDSITATGGGGGGSYNSDSTLSNSQAQNGGSGGGGSWGSWSGVEGTGVSGQGNDGGNNASSGLQSGSGGGGAGSVGGDGGSGGGDGGSGMSSSISGTATYYAGGGSGGGWYNGGVAGSVDSSGAGLGGNDGQHGNDATINSGSGGGGGGGYVNPTQLYGGDGGSGIVIIRYLDDGSITATGGTVTSVTVLDISDSSTNSITISGTGTSVTGTIGTALQDPDLSYSDSDLPSGTSPFSVGGWVKLDESRDSTYDGTNNGATTGVTGKIGDAWDFDGSTDLAVAGGTTTDWKYLTDGSDWTFSGWYNPDTFGTGTGQIIYQTSDGGSSANTSTWAYLSPTGDIIAGMVRSVGGSYVFTNQDTGANVPTTTGTWYMITVVHDGTAGTMKVYVDGVLGGTITSTGNAYSTATNPYTPQIGGDINTGLTWAYHFNGQIDEVIWYKDKAISTSEISTLYNSGNGDSTPDTDSLFAHYNFEQTGSTLENQIYAPPTDTKLLALNDVTFSVGTTSASVVESVYDNVWDFDGSNDYVQLPSLPTGTSYAVSTWVKVDSFGMHRILIDNAVSNGNYLADGASGLRVGNSLAGGGDFNTNTHIPNDGNWHHVVWNVNTPHQIWLDGVSLGTGGSSPSSSTFIPRIGYGSSGALDGSLNDMGVWDRILTSSEVASLYSGNSPTTISSGLIASYNFDQTSGSLLDQTNSYDGTNNGATQNANGQSTSTNIISASSLTDNTSTPHHYAFTKDSSNLWTIYQDGSSVATSTDSTSLGSAGTYTTKLSGTLDEFFIDSTSFTSTEIDTIYERGIAPSLIASPTLSEYDDSGVSAGNIYYYTASAVNSIGESPTIFPLVSADLPSLANAPTNLGGSPNSSGQPVLTWTPSTDLGGGTLLSMEIQRIVTSSGSTWSTIATTSNTSPPYTDTTVTSGISYDYRVASINESGIGAFSTPATIIAGTPPGAPTNLTSVIDNPNPSPLVISLDWDAPSNTGTGTLTGYTVYRDGTQVSTTGLTTDTTDTVSASGTYSYQVKAVSTHGVSIFSSSTSITTPTVPDAPTVTLNIPNPNPSPLTVTANFIPPSNNGGSTITGYNLYHSSDDITYIGVSNPYTVANAGTQYFQGETVNNVGASVRSTTYSITTPTVPDAVTDLAISTYTNTSVTLTWSIPNNGGSNIVDYDVLRTTGGNTVTFANVIGNGYVDSTALTQTTYVYEVFTRNNVGFSTISNQGTVTTYGVPDAPVITATTFDNDRIDLSWTTPNSYGSAITHYVLEYESPIGNGYYTIVPNTGLINSYSHTGLSPLQEYGYRITAVNIYGNSPGGIDTAWTLSDAPTNLVVTPDSTTSQLTLSWTSPNNVGITGYKIERETGIGNGWATIQLTGNTNTIYTDTGLAFGTFYNYRVSTVTPVNVSIPGNTYAQTTFHLPDPVISLTVDDGITGTIVLTWTAPSNPYASIIGYTIYNAIITDETATATATLSTTLDQISAITITDGGSQYLTAPTVTFSLPNGVLPYTTATATTTITNGIVTNITITNNGNGYNTVPTVTISAPVANTIVSATTVLSPLVADTQSSVPNYTIGNIDPASDYSFTVAPITIHGSTILGAKIVSISPDQIFQGVVINIPDEINPNQIPIIFTQTNLGSDTNLMLTYSNSLDITCETTSPFTNIINTYPNLSETAISATHVTHTFTFKDSDNSIIDIYCYDVNNNSTDGQSRISQSVIPLKTQMDNFNNNVFGTGSTFAAIDLLTLIIVIVGMIGFNRKNPAVGLALMGGLLGILSILQIIALETTAIGGFVLIVFLAIIMGMKNR